MKRILIIALLLYSLTGISQTVTNPPTGSALVTSYIAPNGMIYTGSIPKQFTNMATVQKSIQDNKTNTPEAKRISVSDSINTTSALKGSALKITTPFLEQDFYSYYIFKNSTTRAGRLGLSFYQNPTHSETERIFFGSGGSMVFLPGGFTGDSHSGGVLFGDRSATSKKSFGQYVNNGIGYIAFNTDTIQYALTGSFIRNLMSYDETGKFSLTLPDSKFLVGSSADNSSNLQVKRTIVDAIPTFTVDGSQTAGSDMAAFIYNGNKTSSITTNGYFTGVGVRNSTQANAAVATTATGTVISRTVSDSNDALTVNGSASGTGNLLNLVVGSTTSKFKINTAGIIGINGSYLTALQSYRVSAAGTAPEAFTAADDANTVHKTGVESISGTKTFSSSVVVNSSLNATTLAVSGVSNLAGGATSSVAPVGASDLTNKAYVDAGLALKPNLASSNTYTAGTNTFPNAGIIVGNPAVSFSGITNISIGVQDVSTAKSAGINPSSFILGTSTGAVNLITGTVTGTRTVVYPDASGNAVLSSDGSATLDFPSTAASASSDLTLTITGANLGDNVVCSPPVGSVMPNSIYSCWVSATNTVTIRFSNLNPLAASDPPSGVFKPKVIR